eukprot:2726595-Pyramimonas_sp.AAC.1
MPMPPIGGGRWRIKENYPALMGGWWGCPDGQLGFPGNPAAIELRAWPTSILGPAVGSSGFSFQIHPIF